MQSYMLVGLSLHLAPQFLKLSLLISKLMGGLPILEED